MILIFPPLLDDSDVESRRIQFILLLDVDPVQFLHVGDETFDDLLRFCRVQIIVYPELSVADEFLEMVLEPVFSFHPDVHIVERIDPDESEFLDDVPIGVTEVPV